MPVIEVTNLRKQYGRRVAVHDISFTVERGEIFGILGPNGAGKTTTAECVEGLRRPDGGTIRVLGLDPQHDRAALRRVLGAQLQDSQLPDKIRVGEALEMYSSFYANPRGWRELLADLGLAQQRDVMFRKLSGGQKQRLSVALALVGNPRIAILDELTTGLDPQGRVDTWTMIEEIRDRGVTVVLVSHLMEEVERLCDRLAVIDSGRVVALDTPAGLVSKVNAEHRVRFRPSVPLDDTLLADLPEVTVLRRRGDQVEVTGTGALLQAVTTVLARNQIVANDLRYEQARLDDAYLALTARTGKEDQ